MEGNATYVRDTGELASDVLTETTFELHDPQKNFTNIKFTYTWDLGNGYVKLDILSMTNRGSCMHDLISDAEKWSMGQSQLSATITLHQETTPWGWK